MIKGVDRIGDVFKERHGEVAARLASGLPGLTDEGERRRLLGTLIKPTVEEALRAGFSHYDIAREAWRLHRSAGCPVEPRQAVARVASLAARLCSGMPADEFDESYFLHASAPRSLRERLRQVAGWSPDSAFVFGVPCLDEITGGVQPGEMMAVSGAQGSMKTSLLLGGIEDALSRGMSVQFFSLDMTPGEIQERRVQRRLRVGQRELHRLVREGAREIADAERAVNDADENLFDVYGNDGAGRDLTVDDVTRLARARMPNVLCIDYLTLLRRGGQSDLECVNEAMPKIKKVTQLMGIRTVILSQMSRASKREQSSGVVGGHAKGGGIVEETAHSEIELFKDAALDGEPNPVIATVTKNRRGPSGRSYRLYYEAKCMLFTGGGMRVERAGKKGQRRAFENPGAVSPEALADASGMARADIWGAAANEPA
jgi:KaiC/GvpD/RAD55 family RecA-like ATPase